MNCYRCGYDFAGTSCPVCGKHAPFGVDAIGADGNELRIAVLLWPRESFSEETLQSFQRGAVHYRFVESSASSGHHVFVYTPQESSALFRLLQATEQSGKRTILFNGRRRPFDTELWLPLLWYVSV